MDDNNVKRREASLTLIAGLASKRKVSSWCQLEEAKVNQLGLDYTRLSQYGEGQS